VACRITAQGDAKTLRAVHLNAKHFRACAASAPPRAPSALARPLSICAAGDL